MINNIILLLYALLCFSFAPFSQGKGYEKHSNYQYAYSVLIPRNLTVIDDSPPLPQHGFRISLSTEAEAYVWVDGSYNTLDWHNLQEAANTHEGWLKQENANLIEIRHESAFLDKLQALRSLVRYKSSVTGTLMVQDLVLSLRQRRNQTGILYTCGLRTSESRYLKDKEVFEKIIKSWRLRPMPR